MLQLLCSLVFKSFCEIDQVEHFPNAYRSKGNISARVAFLAVANVHLLEVPHFNLAPPAIICSPLHRQMSLSRNIHLHDEISFKLKRGGLILEEISLLLRDEE